MQYIINLFPSKAIFQRILLYNTVEWVIFEEDNFEQVVQI